MKTSLVFAFSLSLGLGLQQSSTAQGNLGDRILNNTKRNVERRIEQNVSRKVDRTVDDAFRAKNNKKNNKTEKEDSKPEPNPVPTNPAPTNSGGGRGGAGNPSPAANSGAASGGRGTSDNPAPAPAAVQKSPFIGSFVLEIKRSENDKLLKDGHQELSYHFADYDIAMVVRDLASKKDLANMIIRRKDKQMVIADSDKKTAQILPYKPESSTATMTDDKPIRVNRLEEVKMVDGRACVKYLIETEEENITAWVDEAASNQVWEAMSLALSPKDQQKFKQGRQFQEIKGLPRESVSVSKKNPKLKTVMNVRRYQEGRPDDQAFELKGYQITDLTTY